VEKHGENNNNRFNRCTRHQTTENKGYYMSFTVTAELIEAVLKRNTEIKYDMTSPEAISQVQTSVDWFLQMPKTQTLRKSSPTAYAVKHRIERQPTGYKGYISEEAAMIAAIICGFPYSLNDGRIGLDEEYYQKWHHVHFEREESWWMFLDGIILTRQ
jgi:hypothetical protein